MYVSTIHFERGQFRPESMLPLLLACHINNNDEIKREEGRN